MSVLVVLSSVQSLMCLGRMIQRQGAATEKALSLRVQGLVLCAGVRKFVLEEQRGRDGLWWWSKWVRSAGGGRRQALFLR